MAEDIIMHDGYHRNKLFRGLVCSSCLQASNADKSADYRIATDDTQVVTLGFLFLRDSQDCEHTPDNFRLWNGQLFGGL
jgi:hypothetical protein